jgi:hypothetical protein
MPETRPLLERVMERVELRPFTLEGFHDRRDRKVRNRRIAAGVVGIAVFVGLIGILTSGGWYDRTETPAVPGATETGPAETEPPPAPASPGVGTCSDGARSNLELTRVDSRIKVRFEVHRSPVGHEWLISLRHHASTIPFPPPWPNAFVFFRGTKVANDSGVLAVQGSIRNRTGLEGYAAYARDMQTGQVCRASAWF